MGLFKAATLFLFLVIAGWGGYDTRQYVVVSSRDWNSPDAVLVRYELTGARWRKIGSPIRVKIGKNGMGWGAGLHDRSHLPKGPVKREGDGRAPAGIFSLTFVFGEKRVESRMPFRIMTRHHRCVDDSRSKYYNRIIDSSKSEKDYRSFERMKLKSNLYKYGIYVAHNAGQKPMAGSCIFMHIKKPDGKPTVGCTAMSEREIVELIRWLDPSKHPLLVQAPEGVIDRLLPFKP